METWFGKCFDKSLTHTGVQIRFNKAHGNAVFKMCEQVGRELRDLRTARRGFTHAQLAECRGMPVTGQHDLLALAAEDLDEHGQAFLALGRPFQQLDVVHQKDVALGVVFLELFPEFGVEVLLAGIRSFGHGNGIAQEVVGGTADNLEIRTGRLELSRNRLEQVGLAEARCTVNQQRSINP